GGAGSVYLGRTEVVAGVFRDVAIKLLHPQLRSEAETAEQLLREARLSASIRHPNVVGVIEANDSPHGLFLAMEYVEGETLAGLIRASILGRRPMPFEIVGRIMCDALSGLHAAHELRDAQGHRLDVVHRDFSPQNILVGVDGTTRLTDFGIAKAVCER